MLQSGAHVQEERGESRLGVPGPAVSAFVDSMEQFIPAGVTEWRVDCMGMTSAVRVTLGISKDTYIFSGLAL